MTAAELRERERKLRAAFDEKRMQAPNPRDFATWEKFYAAQAEHEASLGEIEREIEQVVEAAFMQTPTNKEN